MTKKNKHNGVEIATFIFGLVTLAAVVGYLAVQVFAGRKSPPKLDITVVSMPGECCLYKISIENRGGETAEAANITFMQGNTEVPLFIDYVPANSRREAMLAFPDSSGTRLPSVKSISFNLP